MKILPKIALIFLTITFVSSQRAYVGQTSTSNPKSIYIQGTSCSFYYSDFNNTFSFLSCIDEDNINHNIWNQCIIICCPKMPAGDFSYPGKATLNVCKDWNPEENIGITTIIAILLGVLAGIILLLCILVIICKVYRKSHPNIIPRKNTRQVEPIYINQVEWIEEKELNHVNGDLIWSKNANKANKLPPNHSPCSICLEQNTTSQLHCGHQFHPHCIGTWLRKSDCCPFCRRQNIKGVKVYCQECRWRYFVCTRIMMSMNGKDLPKECKNCQLLLGESQESLAIVRDKIQSFSTLNGKQQSNFIFQDLDP